jgi:hypothetical protein
MRVSVACGPPLTAGVISREGEMTTNLTRYKADLERLIKLGKLMDCDLTSRHLAEIGKLDEEQKKIAASIEGAFEGTYQRWYTEAHAVIRQLIPDRLAEFEQLYKGDGKRREINSSTYHIQDWLRLSDSNGEILGVKELSLVTQ